MKNVGFAFDGVNSKVYPNRTNKAHRSIFAINKGSDCFFFSGVVYILRGLYMNIFISTLAQYMVFGVFLISTQSGKDPHRSQILM